MQFVYEEEARLMYRYRLAALLTDVNLKRVHRQTRIRGDLMVVWELRNDL